mmetsp:Transcript_126393/g.236227  ORF Transcript_126393/g.236227 Transcript_126393/m.236227 type:complete len:128 (+) Transcript_126393:3-386(+)
MQDFGSTSQAHRPIADDATFEDADSAAQYHQLEDDEYRPPMQTGYVDRLIDPPMENWRLFALPPFDSEEDLARYLEVHNRLRWQRWLFTASHRCRHVYRFASAPLICVFIWLIAVAVIKRFQMDRRH